MQNQQNYILNRYIRRLPLLVMDKIFSGLDEKSMNLFARVIRFNHLSLFNMNLYKYLGIFDHLSTAGNRFIAYRNSIRSVNKITMPFYKIDFVGFYYACETGKLDTVKYFEEQLITDIYKHIKQNAKSTKRHFELYEFAFEFDKTQIDMLMPRMMFNKFLVVIDYSMVILLKNKSKDVIDYLWNKKGKSREFFRERLILCNFVTNNNPIIGALTSMENYVYKVICCAKNLKTTMNLPIIQNEIDSNAAKYIFQEGKSFVTEYYSGVLSKKLIIKGIRHYYIARIKTDDFNDAEYFRGLIGEFELAKITINDEKVFFFIFDNAIFAQQQINELFLVANSSFYPNIKIINKIFERKPKNLGESYRAFVSHNLEKSGKVHIFYINLMKDDFINNHLPTIIDNCYSVKALKLLYSRTKAKNFYGLLCIKIGTERIIREFDDIAYMTLPILLQMIEEHIEEDLFEFFVTKFSFTQEEKIALLDYLEKKDKLDLLKIFLRVL